VRQRDVKPETQGRNPVAVAVADHAHPHPGEYAQRQRTVQVQLLLAVPQLVHRQIELAGEVLDPLGHRP